jgi:hypothetical protein
MKPNTSHSPGQWANGMVLGRCCQFSGVVTTGETKVQKQSFMENFLLRQKEGIRICWMLL